MSQPEEELGSPAFIPGIGSTRLHPSGDFEVDRRQALRAFLMSRRARLQPGDVGLPETSRRRTPGLRREEVAQLAGLSTEWYTVFEMAKDLRVSMRTVDAVAKALRLSATEAGYLRTLVTVELPPRRPTATEADVDPTLLAVLDGYAAGPAILLNARMDVIAANPLAIAVFGDLAGATGSFRDFWNSHEVRRQGDSLPLTITHPTLGTLRFAMRLLSQLSTVRTYCCFLVPLSEPVRLL